MLTSCSALHCLLKVKRQNVCVPLTWLGTETRVSAQQQAYGYMFAYIETMKKVGRVFTVPRL